MSNKRVSSEVKLEIVKKYLAGEASQRQLAIQCGVTKSTIATWTRLYESRGERAFTSNAKNIYSFELKYKVVHEYMAGDCSIEYLCKKYDITSRTMVYRWIKRYNSHGTFEDRTRKRVNIMTVGRETTYDERVEIVKYCITNDKNYIQTSEKYGISYQQARNYVKRYEANGFIGLKDNRGKRKTKDQMTELELLRAENKILKAQKREMEMEVSFLKKLDEIGRRSD